MTTAKHAAANRRNAQASTGPTSDEGRERAKMNALTHGLAAKTVIVSAERTKDYEVFRDAMFEDRAPVRALECLLVERIVVCAWRLRRAVRTEAELNRGDDLPEIGADTLRLGLVGSDAFSTTDQEAALLRYETAIERGLYRAIHNLERIQARRLGEDVAAPLAIDIDRDAKPETP